ncbi:hypothetical protein BT69DRAFT_1286015 [Atractiella rhizophila]|nr:hypothetical protein BT69DRAFT_1286015 [Atractiella rhizophila]
MSLTRSEDPSILSDRTRKSFETTVTTISGPPPAGNSKGKNRFSFDFSGRRSSVSSGNTGSSTANEPTPTTNTLSERPERRSLFASRSTPNVNDSNPFHIARKNTAESSAMSMESARYMDDLNSRINSVIEQEKLEREAAKARAKEIMKEEKEKRKREKQLAKMARARENARAGRMASDFWVAG